MNGNLAYKLETREEIIDGKVVMMAPASINHNRINKNISRIFDDFFQGKKCEYFIEAGLYLTADVDEYVPDGMVVCDPNKVKGDSGVYGTPDLVVEILSRSTARYDKGRKKDIYERFGVREYWIVDPLSLSLEQYALENGKFILRDVYHKYPSSTLSNMKEAERAAIVTEFQCAIFDGLTVKLDDVFGRVIIG